MNIYMQSLHDEIMMFEEEHSDRIAEAKVMAEEAKEQSNKVEPQ